MKKKQGKKPNLKVIIYSLIALIFMGLTIFVDWMFVLGAVIMIWLNQRELMGKR